MKGWRARLGFLIPPGNPTVEPEMIAMAPPGVSVHFSRMVAGGAAGTHHGQEERNRSQIEHIDESAALLAIVKPNVMMLAHTATSYTLGCSSEADLLNACRRNTRYRSRPHSAAWPPRSCAWGKASRARHALQRRDHAQRQGAPGELALRSSATNASRMSQTSTPRRPSAPTSLADPWTIQKPRRFS